MEQNKDTVLVFRREDLHPESMNKDIGDVGMRDFRDHIPIMQDASLIIFLDETSFPEPTGKVLKSRWTGASGIIGGNEAKELKKVRRKLELKNDVAIIWEKRFIDIKSKYEIATRVNIALIIVGIGILLWELLN
jgi:hypothetical protein